MMMHRLQGETLQTMKKVQIPASLYSKDKKANHAIERELMKEQIGRERKKMSTLLHDVKAGFLEVENEGEQTVKVTQRQINESVSVEAAAKMFQIELGGGPYSCCYSVNGSSVLLTGGTGHTALIRWREKEVQMEVHLKDRIYAATFLHNDEMVAVSQGAGTFLYDERGIELHRLPKCFGVEYLPYHFLLVTADRRRLRYYDTTSGAIVADHAAKNPYGVMRQNASNAVIALGSSKGVVELWTPGIGTPVVSLFVGAALQDIAFHKGYMVTTAEDLGVWDMRMLRPLHRVPLLKRTKNICLSQAGLLCLNYSDKLEVFKDYLLDFPPLPYLKHQANRARFHTASFAPFEDVLGVATHCGFLSLLVPGSGSPFYDTFETNPFESKKQKRQTLVHRLLEKLPFETITLDPNILGGISRMDKDQLEKEEQALQKQKERERIDKILLKKKAKGKRKIGNKVLFSRRRLKLGKSSTTNSKESSSTKSLTPSFGLNGPKRKKNKKKFL